MKNKKAILYSILLIGLLILSVNTGWCAPASAVPAVSVLKKFAIAMGGVLISLAFIWFGLNAYKKFTPKGRANQKDLYNDGLTSPKTVDEAVSFFINKNRLK